MNSAALSLPSQNESAQHRVEFFRLPQPGKRDPYFGLSRAWYYKASSLGEIRMISVRQRGALRGVRLVVYDSVADYIRRSAQLVANEDRPALASNQLPKSVGEDRRGQGKFYDEAPLTIEASSAVAAGVRL